MTIRKCVSRATLLLAGILIFLFSSPALSQMTCGSREALLKHLAQQFQEAPVAIGLSGDGKAVELLTSTTGSWSLVVTVPRGISCLVGSGEAWQALPSRLEREARRDEKCLPKPVPGFKVDPC